jgi:hypothetical protein
VVHTPWMDERRGEACARVRWCMVQSRLARD